LHHSLKVGVDSGDASLELRGKLKGRWKLISIEDEVRDVQKKLMIVAIHRCHTTKRWR
jgi:hypothetical protein